MMRDCDYTAWLTSHVCTLLSYLCACLCWGNPAGNPGIIVVIQRGCVCAHAHVALRVTHPSSLAADPWVWAACHRCHQHHPAAARCAAQIQMTCMPTWPARCLLPALALPPQIIPAKSRALRGTDLHTEETKTRVSAGNKAPTVWGHTGCMEQHKNHLNSPKDSYQIKEINLFSLMHNSVLDMPSPLMAVW